MTKLWQIIELRLSTYMGHRILGVEIPVDLSCNIGVMPRGHVERWELLGGLLAWTWNSGGDTWLFAQTHHLNCLSLIEAWIRDKFQSTSILSSETDAFFPGGKIGIPSENPKYTQSAISCPKTIKKPHHIGFVRPLFGCF